MRRFPCLARPCGGLLALLAILAALPATSTGAVPDHDASRAWPGVDLFADGVLTTIQIEISAQDLDQLRKEAREFVRARVTESGTTYSNVAVHLKGSVGSFRPVEDKPALTLDFARFHPGQRFHALRRIHLNNSVEDPSYCNEQLGSELFRAAGIPAARAGHALVFLNQRRLGLYVLKEGFTEDFLSCYFHRIGGNLFEPGEGHDVNQRLKRTAIEAPRQDRAALHRLAKAALEGDVVARWRLLGRVLDVDRFTRFMALEVMLGHRDGYCLARNNFRLYQDLDSGKMVFIPHGMDQLFGSAELPWRPHMAGLLAQAVLETPEGNELYRETITRLVGQLLVPQKLTNRVNEIVGGLRQGVDGSEFKQIETAAASLNQRIQERCRYLAAELSRPVPGLLEFHQGTASLANWTRLDEPAPGQMDQGPGPGQVPCLRIQSTSPTTASWRTTARLGPGRYRFEGRVCVQEVKPLGFGKHQGAGLRIGGQVRQSPDLTGTAGWQTVSESFQVAGAAQEVEFICELRAAGGIAWFEQDSLKIVQAP